MVMAVYSNRFTIHLSDVARITFQDERLPMSIGLTSEVVMTIDNFKELIKLGEQMLNDK